MHTYLTRLQRERDSLTQTATALAETAATEDRDLTDTERNQLGTMQTRCAEIDGQLTTYSQQLDSQRAYARLRATLEDQSDQDGHQGQNGQGAGAAGQLQLQQRNLDSRSWGQLVTDSLEFRAYNGRGSSGVVEVPMELRAPIQIDTFPGNLPPYYFSPALWTMTTPLLDVIGKVTTNSNVVEWYSWPNNYPMAGVVPEGTPKPEADITPVPHTDSLATVAHYKPISRQSLEDIPQIQSIVEGALRGGVLRKLEDLAVQALLADVTIPNVNNSSLLAGIRVGIGTVQSAGYAQPNAVLLNPADFADLDLAIMAATSNGAQLQSQFWGVRALAVAAIPVGTAYVGDMNTALTLFSRNSTAVYMTDSHADYFVRNLLVILAETRALAAMTEADAACKVTVVTVP